MRLPALVHTGQLPNTTTLRVNCEGSVAEDNVGSGLFLGGASAHEKLAILEMNDLCPILCEVVGHILFLEDFILLLDKWSTGLVPSEFVITGGDFEEGARCVLLE